MSEINNQIRGVYVGRFNPLHKGHQAVINYMISECGNDNSLLLLGSSNAPFTLRHYFSYDERSKIIQSIYPSLTVAGIPDYPTDNEWLKALDDILKIKFDNTEVVYFGGCEEDLQFFLQNGRNCKILNRFDGTTPNISATEVRDALIYKRPLDKYLDEKVLNEVSDLFEQKWEKFKKI